MGWVDLESTHTLRIERQNGLDRDIHSTESILREHDLAHPLSVHLWVHGWFRQQHFTTSRVNAQFLRESVVPEMLHVLPVAHDTVLHRLGDLEVVAVLCGLVSDHHVLDYCRASDALFCTQDGSADDRGEYCMWKGSSRPTKGS